MAKLTRPTKEDIKRILNTRLSLKDPEYRLEKTGTRFVGDVISASFKGKRDHQRQEMIWNALDDALGARAPILVGMLLAYTPDEWNLGAEDNVITRRVKKAG